VPVVTYTYIHACILNNRHVLANSNGLANSIIRRPNHASY